MEPAGHLEVGAHDPARVRELRFHHPETLPVDELYFKFHLTKGIAPTVYGPRLEDVLRAWTPLITYLEPGEKREVELELVPLGVRISDIMSGALLFLTPNTEARVEDQNVTLKLADGKFEVCGTSPSCSPT